jgi:tetratricopeptide (TPR) repeat protein
VTKIGRNDPCPCGSGKKYKKCCGAVPAASVEAAAPPPSGRWGTERALAEVTRLLSEKEFASPDEINAFLHQALSAPDRSPRPPRTPIEKAQDLMYEAWEASGARRARLARQALAVSPDCADAYVLLAEETARTVGEACDLYAKGLAAGERALGDQAGAFAGRFWGVLETRPYMRALAGLASCLWLEGRRREAIEHWEQMLRLNPNDNQGVRYMLLAELLEEGDDARAEALLKRYPGDAAASWDYGRALLAFRRHGDTPTAKRARTRALDTNPYVPAYLTGRKKLPGTMPDYVGFGDESEAITCAAEQMAAWRRTPGALEWLAPAQGGDTTAPARIGVVYQLKVTLKGTSPPIWRRLLVPADTRLSKLHVHQFEVGRRCIGVPSPDDDWREVEDERKIRLSEIAAGEKARFTYEYDFGDSWEHAILVEKVLPPEKGARYPACVGGRRACPPEDVGGVWGYETFLEAIADPTHEEREEMLEWVGGAFDPEAFDAEEVSRSLRRLR